MSWAEITLLKISLLVSCYFGSVQIGAHDPSEEGSRSFAWETWETFVKGENGCDFVNSEPKTNQFPFLLSNIWDGIKRQISLVI